MAYKFSKGNRGLGDITFEDDADTGLDFDQDRIDLQTNGQTRLKINKNAKQLMECLELQSYTEKREPDKDAGYDHMNDALGYITWRLFNPLHLRAGKGTGIRLY